jgi:hypothetical protein
MNTISSVCHRVEAGLWRLVMIDLETSFSLVRMNRPNCRSGKLAAGRQSFFESYVSAKLERVANKGYPVDIIRLCYLHVPASVGAASSV